MVEAEVVVLILGCLFMKTVLSTLKIYTSALCDNSSSCTFVICALLCMLPYLNRKIKNNIKNEIHKI